MNKKLNNKMKNVIKNLETIFREDYFLGKNVWFLVIGIIGIVLTNVFLFKKYKKTLVVFNMLVLSIISIGAYICFVEDMLNKTYWFLAIAFLSVVAVHTVITKINKSFTKITVALSFAVVLGSYLRTVDNFFQMGNFYSSEFNITLGVVVFTIPVCLLLFSLFKLIKNQTHVYSAKLLDDNFPLGG